jgi:hypothetical protein
MINRRAPQGNGDLLSKVHAIQTSGNEASVHRMTQLLIDALCDEDHRSLSALSDFFGLPAVGPNPPTAHFELGLVQRARLLIDGENAHRVESWILSYETSELGSDRRLLYENILGDFVSAKSEIEALKIRVRQAHALAIDVWSKCEALTGISRNMRFRTNRENNPIPSAYSLGY